MLCSFFLVFWQHGFLDLFIGITDNQLLLKPIFALTITGGIGVHIFFTISGFLITFLMLKEESETGKFNLGFFYVRRILRIWPLYYVVMVLGLYILPHVNNAFHDSGNELMNMTFLNNFAMRVSASNINIAWSVAIEEQFYLIWPLLFIFFRNKKLLSFVCITLFAISTFYTLDFQDTYADTMANLRYLMMGCLGAIFYYKHKPSISTSYLMEAKSFYFILILGIFLTVAKDFYGPYYYFSLVLLPLFYLYLVVFSVEKSTENDPQSIFSRLGKYTYGMYMYHPIVLIFTGIFFKSVGINYTIGAWKFIFPLLSLVFTIGLSILSYEFFEKHILRFKSKFSFIKTRI